MPPVSAYRPNPRLVLSFLLGAARVKHNLMRFFDPEWARDRFEQRGTYRFATIKSAVRAFNTRAAKAASPDDAA